jgi:ankyrin repeat protein
MLTSSSSNSSSDFNPQFSYARLHFLIAYRNIDDRKKINNILKSIPPEKLYDVFKIQDSANNNLLATAFFLNDISIFRSLLLFLSSTPNLLQELLTQENKDGHSILLQAISHNKIEFVKEILSSFLYVNNFEIVKEILSSLSSSPKLLRGLLIQDNQKIYSIFQQIFLSDRMEIVKEILLSLSLYPRLLQEFLIQESKDGYPNFQLAVFNSRIEIVKEILLSLSLYPVILQELLIQENIKGYSILKEAIINDRTDIIKEILLSPSLSPDVLRELLIQGDEYGYSILQQAVLNGGIEIVNEILSSLSSFPDLLQEILEQKNKSNETAIFCALKRIIKKNDPNDKIPDEILKIIVKKQFVIDLDESQKKVLIEYAKNLILLNLMTLEQFGFIDKKLVKILDEKISSSESLSSNPISQIYQQQLIKINSNEPIMIKDNKSLYLYRAEVQEHHACLVFCVDNETKKLLSINYCDGNLYDKLGDRRFNGWTRRSFGVRQLEPEDNITFSAEFVKKIIDENFKKNIEELKLPLCVDGKEINIKKRTDCIDIKPQSRGNCTLKTSNILARYLFLMVMNKDYHQYYEEFKQDLRKEVINAIPKCYEEIDKLIGTKVANHLMIKENMQKLADSKFGRKQHLEFKKALKYFEDHNLKQIRDEDLAMSSKTNPDIKQEPHRLPIPVSMPSPKIKANCINSLIAMVKSKISPKNQGKNT